MIIKEIRTEFKHPIISFRKEYLGLLLQVLIIRRHRCSELSIFFKLLLPSSQSKCPLKLKELIKSAMFRSILRLGRYVACNSKVHDMKTLELWHSFN